MKMGSMPAEMPLLAAVRVTLFTVSCSSKDPERLWVLLHARISLALAHSSWDRQQFEDAQA